MTPEILKFKKLHADALVPTRGSAEAACFDLYVDEDTTLEPFEGELVKTGIAFEIPEGFCVQVYLRSSMCKRGILAATGIIDRDFTGEVCVQATNVTDRPIHLMRGSRIGQAMLIRTTPTELLEVEALRATQRGTNGWGSTGV